MSTATLEIVEVGSSATDELAGGFGSAWLQGYSGAHLLEGRTGKGALTGSTAMIICSEARATTCAALAKVRAPRAAADDNAVDEGGTNDILATAVAGNCSTSIDTNEFRLTLGKLYPDELHFSNLEVFSPAARYVSKSSRTPSQIAKELATRTASVAAGEIRFVFNSAGLLSQVASTV